MSIDTTKQPVVGPIEPIAESVCVLFDPATGAVRHIHQVATLPGGEVLAEHAVEAHARGLAIQAGLDGKGLHALHVDKKQLVKGHAHYRVDPKTRQLHVEVRPKPTLARR